MGSGVGRGLGVIAAVLAAVLALAGAASAAQLVDRDATGVQIAVNAKGEALVTYRKGSALKRVLVWGAINALPPTPGTQQVKFHLDYAGGWGKYRTLYWQHFADRCAPYEGPALPNVVAACTAPDGTYWAAQEWPQPLPDLGFTPWLPTQRQQWLEVSHWSGELAQLETGMHWVYDGRFQSIFGRLTYDGRPVYGPGWYRENSFVVHNPSGVFCYGFYPFDVAGYPHPDGQNGRRGPGVGTEYRLFAEGPGVTPDIAALVPGSHPYSRGDQADIEQERAAAAQIRGWGDKACRTG